MSPGFAPGDIMLAKLAEFLGDELLQLDGVCDEHADAFRSLLGGHGVFVEEEAEGFLGDDDAVDVGRLGGGDA